MLAQFSVHVDGMQCELVGTNLGFTVFDQILDETVEEVVVPRESSSSLVLYRKKL